jgi:hypothetical protein
MEKISPPVRILAIVIVLAGAAGMLALRMLGPAAVEPPLPAAAAVLPKPKPVKAAAAKPATPVTPARAKAAPPVKQAATAKSATAKTATTKSAPAKAAPIAAVKAPKPVPATGFPRAVDAALAKHEVLVVSLVLPGARVDSLAAAEAQAGAKLGGAGYLALNVLNESVARALLTKLGVLEDPTLLVLTKGGEVALRLNGFIDRDIVAQAAANASS